jgi:hypothetical protein
MGLLGVGASSATYPIEHVPEDLSRLILAALCPDPDERLPTADHFQRALEAIRLTTPPASPRPPPSP